MQVLKRFSRDLLIICFALGGWIGNAGAEDFSALVFSKTLLFRHASITNGIEAIRKLGAENHFHVDATEDASAFTAPNLGKYKVIIFLSTTGEVLNEEQQTAFKDYIEKGGGLAGVHAAVAGDLATEGTCPDNGCARMNGITSLQVRVRRRGCWRHWMKRPTKAGRWGRIIRLPGAGGWQKAGFGIQHSGIPRPVSASHYF